MLGSGILRGRRPDMPFFRRAILATLILCPVSTQAQGTSELWPELHVYWTPAEHQRTFLELSASSERESSKREATIGLYQDYLRLPRAFFRAGYRFTFSTHDASYRESRGVAEANVTMATWGKLRLINRTRAELRWINGDESYRLRDRLHLQRVSSDTRGPAWAPYVTCEAYYDSRYAGFSRIAGRLGTEARIRGPVTTDVYVARQNNLRGISPPYVNALGLIMKLQY
jgi:hypothetical protein